MRAETIDQVIAELDVIIEQARQENSPLGYFPALYRQVTIEVKKRIAEGYFDDGARMERLDVGFANRYLDAYKAFTTNQPTTSSWQLAFDAAKDNRPIVLQHLFLGMSAHINLDLGIVASEISPGERIHRLENDFNKINEVLASLVDQVQRRLAKIWWRLKIIDWLAGKLDEAVADFSIDIARQGAWNVATDLAGIDDESSRERYITDLDNRVTKFGNRLYKPGIILGLVVKFIRATEKGDVRTRISYLEGDTTSTTT